MGTVSVDGRLPKEVVERVVRRHFAQFRFCYETGLRQNPSLRGRVTTRVAIGPDGTVQSTHDGGSDMPDQSVVQCVLRRFYNVEFPKPEGGVANATVPLMFSTSQP